MTNEANLARERVEASIEAGDAAGARTALGDLWRREANAATAAFVVSRYAKIREQASHTSARMALLRSFTVEPMVPLLRAGAACAGIDLEVQVGDFNAYAQEILDPRSGLYAFDPTVVVLAVRLEDVAPELSTDLAGRSEDDVREDMARLLDAYRGYLSEIRGRSEADVIVHGFAHPARPTGGLLPQGIDPVTELNAGLREIAAELAGVHVLDYDGLTARHGRLAWEDRKKWLAVRLPIAADCHIHMANEWLRFLHPVTGTVCKVLVCDLDNTLWGGVIGEDGLDGIQLGPEPPGAAYLAVQRAALELQRRGIVLAVCSKNNLDDALEVFEKHPDMLLQEKHFAALRINWLDKAQNLREIAHEINVGTEALAFLDDNPAERELVRAHLPEVTVLEVPDDPMQFAPVVLDSPVFERLTLSEEDRVRGQMYTEQRQRRELEASAGSLEDFYRSLDMRAEIALVDAASLPRTAQLTQKTNQFNLTTKRYSEQSVAELADDPGWEIYTTKVVDRFGDNGIVGVMIVHRATDHWEIDTFLMSCRVIGRTVETAMLATLAERAREAGATRLVGHFLPTRKNAPARDFYAAHGFREVPGDGDGTRYEIDLTRETIAAPEWIERQVLIEESVS